MTGRGILKPSVYKEEHEDSGRCRDCLNSLGRPRLYTHPSHCLVAQMVKNPPAMMETWVQSLGREDVLKKGMATHSSILSGVFQGRGLTKSPTQLSD